MTSISNQIIHGEATQTVRGLNAGSVDLVVTDPPYLCGYRDRTGRTVVNDQNSAGVLPVFPELYRVLRPNSYCVLFCGWNATDQFSNAWAAAGFRTSGHIVWRKDYASSTRHLKHQHESAWILMKGNPYAPRNPLPDVQQWVYSCNRSHPTEKAVKIIAPLIESYSNPGDLVLDPFLGSGTAAVAAALAGRAYVGIELEEKYCTLARNRLAGVARFQQRNVSAPSTEAA